MYVLIELLEQKKTRVYRLIYTKKDKTFFSDKISCHSVQR